MSDTVWAAALRIEATKRAALAVRNQAERMATCRAHRERVGLATIDGLVRRAQAGDGVGAWEAVRYEGASFLATWHLPASLAREARRVIANIRED